MFAITGITGQVGGAVARELLAAGKPVRAVVRSAAKGEVWAKRGCDVALAEIGDASALQAAFAGAEGVFVLLPSSFDPAPGFPEVRSIVSGIRCALAAVRPERIVALSTIGVQAKDENLLSQLGVMERELGELPAPVAFLRPAWFMENAAWDITPARERGVVPSFLQPLDKPFPMVATADVGAVAAELLQETWSGRRIVELEGPRRVTPNEIAAALSELLGRPVRAEAVSRSTWEELFTSQGMKHPTARMRMLDGFNDGWIEFEAGPKGSRKGRIDIVAVLRDLVALSS
jgi:uncharacterized protein YbjT (DUF2867 family)